jgi:hypothetical protein
MWTLHRFARLVKQLRKVQCNYGSGYKTPAGGAEAKRLEQEVDAAIGSIERLAEPGDEHGEPGR